MTKFGERFLGIFAATQATAEHEVLDQIGRANRAFSEEFGAVEEPHAQFEELRIGGPHIEEDGTRAVRAEKTVEARDNAVAIGEEVLARRETCRRRTEIKKATEQLESQLHGARRDVAVTRAVDKLVEQTERTVNVLKGVTREKLFPFGFAVAELARERLCSGLFRSGRLE